MNLHSTFYSKSRNLNYKFYYSFMVRCKVTVYNRESSMKQTFTGIPRHVVIVQENDRLYSFDPHSWVPMKDSRPRSI